MQEAAAEAGSSQEGKVEVAQGPRQNEIAVKYKIREIEPDFLDMEETELKNLADVLATRIINTIPLENIDDFQVRITPASVALFFNEESLEIGGLRRVKGQIQDTLLKRGFGEAFTPEIEVFGSWDTALAPPPVRGGTPKIGRTLAIS